MTNSTLGPGMTMTSRDIAAKARTRSVDTMAVIQARIARMDRGRCGPLVVARNAPGFSPERGSGEPLGTYELTCVVTRLEKVVSRV